MLTLADKIRRYLAKHPDAKVKDVAEKFNTSPPYVYVLRSKLNSLPPETEVEDVQTKGAKVESRAKVELPVQMLGMPTDVDATLAERGTRYGKFTGHAEVTTKLKRTIGSELSKRDKRLADDQQEALDMICHKIGRIVNGDPDYADSWVDIAGYAKLVADRLETGREV